MKSCARVRDHLDTYADGELRWLMRQHVERHLARCPGCRTELRQRRAIGELLREMQGPAPETDGIWSAIQPQLARIDADWRPRPVAPRSPDWRRRLATLTSPLPWIAHPAGMAAAAGLVALAFAMGGGPREPTHTGVVRWLDAHGSPVMLLEEEDATIIWLIDSAFDESTSARRGFGGLI